MTFFSQEPLPQDHAAEPDTSNESRRSTVHAVGAMGLIVLPIILVFASLLTAFQKWGYREEAERAAIDQKAFPLMIAAGVIMGISALALFVLRVDIRGRFAGGNAWVVLAVLALPVAGYLVLTGVSNL